jgi:hypothetical protein
MSQYFNMDMCSMLYEADGVRFFYLGERVLNVGLDASFDNM